MFIDYETLWHLIWLLFHLDRPTMILDWLAGVAQDLCFWLVNLTMLTTPSPLLSALWCGMGFLGRHAVSLGSVPHRSTAFLKLHFSAWHRPGALLGRYPEERYIKFSWFQVDYFDVRGHLKIFSAKNWEQRILFGIGICWWCPSDIHQLL